MDEILELFRYFLFLFRYFMHHQLSFKGWNIGSEKDRLHVTFSNLVEHDGSAVVEVLRVEPGLIVQLEVAG